MKYQNIAFDVYGTMVDIHTDEQNLSLWEQMRKVMFFYGVQAEACDLKTLFFLLCEKQMKERKLLCDYPEIDVVSVVECIFEINARKVSRDIAVSTAQIMRALSTEYIRVYDGVIETLKELKKQGRKLYVLSNAQACFTQKELDMLGLSQYFDGILFSSDYGVAKPSKTFFDALIDKFSLDRQSTVYVGNDEFSDMFGASNAGIDCVWLKTNHTPKSAVCKTPPTFTIENGDFAELLHIL